MLTLDSLPSQASLKDVMKGITIGLEGLLITSQNPTLHETSFLRIIFYLTVLSTSLYFIIIVALFIPFFTLRSFIYFCSFILPINYYSISLSLDHLSNSIRDSFFSVPLLMLVLLFLRYLRPQPLDELFMDSLKFIDQNTNHQLISKPEYYSVLSPLKFRYSPWDGLKEYIKRTWTKFWFFSFVYVLSSVSYFHGIVIPVAGGYQVSKSLGVWPGFFVGALIYLFPDQQPTIFYILTTTYAMRALTRELLEPYFVRISHRMTPQERKEWFNERTAILYGFSMVAYTLSAIPVLGVFGFGLAQASAAHLLMSITDSPLPEPNAPRRRRSKNQSNPPPHRGEENKSPRANEIGDLLVEENNSPNNRENTNQSTHSSETENKREESAQSPDAQPSESENRSEQRETQSPVVESKSEHTEST